MNGTKLLVAVVVTAAVAGCSGMQYAMDNYNHVTVISFEDPDTKVTYRVFDKPEENRMMITSSAGDALSRKVIGKPGVAYETAAMNYLHSIGRDCRATKTVFIVEPQYEVQYAC